MLRLPEFTYLAPRSLHEAVRLLSDSGPDGALMAGGTDLLPHMKRRQRTPHVIIGLRHLAELRGIRSTQGAGVAIGAASTLAEVARHPEILAGYSALAQAIGQIGTPAIRQMGTIGGNVLVETRCACYDLPAHTREALGHCLKEGGPICLVAPRSPRCWAIASSDTAPILIALGARARLVDAGGERVVSLADLYRDDGLRPLALRRGEILTEILLPPADGVRAAYRKVRRRGAIDFPMLGVAVAMRCAPDGVVADARIVLGAIASAPVIAHAAADALTGRTLDPPTVVAAAEAAAKVARPLENADLAAAWRKQMVRVTVERALRSLAA